ncbi:hypothetical protein T484DRAFT_1874262 [Baffinella frigidus]|nr:hypothetical protein T484DRAFT_1874262 [Cryptophyta sp. CCMP2293]
MLHRLSMAGIDEGKEAVDASVDLSTLQSTHKCTDAAFLTLNSSGAFLLSPRPRRDGALVKKVDGILRRMAEQEVLHVENSALDLLSHACELHLRNMVERLVAASKHRSGALAAQLPKDIYPPKWAAAAGGEEGEEAALPGIAHADLAEQEEERRAANARVADGQGAAPRARAEQGYSAGRVRLGDALYVLAEERDVGSMRILMRHAQRLDPALA